MASIKKNFAYVLKSIKKDRTLQPKITDLTNKTYVISGGTRGIGLSIAKSLSSLGANITLLGKTSTPHVKLEGTMDTAKKEVLEKNPNKTDNVLGSICDIRNVDMIEESINKTIEKFGKIDGVILNASALCLNPTLKQTSKEVDLMSNVNINGTFFVGQYCLKHIKNSDHPSVLLIAPPIDMLYNDDWWTNHLYYSISKFNMSLMAKFWDKEFQNVSVNTLWPRTTINTAPVKNLLGGEEMVNISRKKEIVGEAAKHIICADPIKCTGKNFIDDEVLASLDIDVEQYRVDKNIKERDLMPDFFC